MVAVKFREVMHPSISDLSTLSNCGPEEISDAEVSVITALDWDVHVSSGVFLSDVPFHFTLVSYVTTFLPTAVDVADKLLEKFEGPQRRPLRKLVAFLLQVSYCCRVLVSALPPAPVAVACVTYAARTLGISEDLLLSFLNDHQRSVLGGLATSNALANQLAPARALSKGLPLPLGAPPGRRVRNLYLKRDG